MVDTAARAGKTHPSGLERRDEIAIAFFGTWMVTGLFLDGWAHNADKPETFFSPWHGVLYSGFGAAVAYFGLQDLVLRRSRRLQLGSLVTFGFALFVAGAMGDFVWHEIFGIEVDLEALLSPTHLALMIGGLLMLSGPVRVAWERDERAPSLRRFFPTLVAVTLMVGVASFFTMYFSAFRFGGLHSAIGRPDFAEFQQLHGIGSVLVTNALLVGMTLAVRRRWQTPFGSFTFLYGAVAFATAGLDAFEFPKVIVAAFVAGILTDVAASRLDPSVERLRASRAFGALVPLFLWGTWLIAERFSNGISWTVELWVGVVILAIVSGLALSVLVVPPVQAAAD
jgi:hypothetical protein